MHVFFSVIGFLGMITFLIMAVVAKLRKMDIAAKRNLSIAGFSFIVFIVGILLTPDDDTTGIEWNGAFSALLTL